jgi:phosphatidylserine decarboxylase
MSPFVLLQHLTPRLALTRLGGLIAQARAGALTTAIIRSFVRRYGVNMAEAAQPDIAQYETFNAFFTRALRPDARPLADAGVLCPVDGAVSQMGAIQGDSIFQAKGHEYSTRALLGGDATLAQSFHNGTFATIYLSPRDYHRIHMPHAAKLQRMIHVPGDLFSVNPLTVTSVPGLFARNERLVCVFDTPQGQPFVMVLVGATIVGSMATVWHGVVNPPRPGQVRQWQYEPGQHELQAGAEMGRFLLGSTVVLLWPHQAVQLNAWEPGQQVRMGQAMGEWLAR